MCEDDEGSFVLYEHFQHLESRTARLREALEAFVDRMHRFGEWDDGCFYYAKHAASELQDPLRKAQQALADRA